MPRSGRSFGKCWGSALAELVLAPPAGPVPPPVSVDRFQPSSASLVHAVVVDRVRNKAGDQPKPRAAARFNPLAMFVLQIRMQVSAANSGWHEEHRTYADANHAAGSGAAATARSSSHSALPLPLQHERHSIKAHVADRHQDSQSYGDAQLHDMPVLQRDDGRCRTVLCRRMGIMVSRPAGGEVRAGRAPPPGRGSPR